MQNGTILQFFHWYYPSDGSLWKKLAYTRFTFPGRKGKHSPFIWDHHCFSGVTLVGNHDTQPLQSREAPIGTWFKPLAYALLLLRDKGYPRVFYPDLYGAKYTDKAQDGEEHRIDLTVVKYIELLLRARKCFAYGTQRDYLDASNCIGWTREGDETLEGSGCAVLLGNGDAASKIMEIGKTHTGKIFKDLLGNSPETVTIDATGNGDFHVAERTLSIWAEQDR